MHVADWGSPQGPVMRAAFVIVQLVDGFTTTDDNVKGRIPAMLRDAGLVDVDITGHLRTLYGTLTLIRGERPRDSSTAPLVCRKGDRVRIRIGNLSAMDHHPIHMHGHYFKVVATDGGPLPVSAQ